MNIKLFINPYSKTKPKMELTKNLYFKNDVKWALYYSLMNKKEDETIFWLCEYYESGYENESWGNNFHTLLLLLC